MPSDMTQILTAAEKLGQLITEHPAMQRYVDAQKAVAGDPEASRLFGEFDRVVQELAQQEQSGRPLDEAQRMRLQQLQQTIATNLRVKAFSLAQYELTDVLRQVSQAWQKPVARAQSAARGEQPAAPAPASGPRIVMG